MTAPNRANTTAISFLSALRHLDREGPMTLASLARADGRVLSNLRRDTPKLESTGLVSLRDGETLVLTDTGRRWVQGQDIAEGLATPPASPSATPLRWPAAAIRPNPLNHKVTGAGIEDLAENIRTAGDILQPLLLTPPDANGVRTILAGERRWRAVRHIMADDAEAMKAGGLCTPGLPAALVEGLPFIEREATETEAMVITLLENSNRLDLSPWEDAQQLLKIAEATGWNASELARRVGRAGSERDVQTKLKIAREASPEAIADYEAIGSWDRLRDSVRRIKGPENIHLALFLVEAALRSEDETGVWDGILVLDDGLHWPEDWKKWFAYDADNGHFCLTDAACTWLAAEGLGDDPDEVLYRRRGVCGLVGRKDLRPFVTSCLNWTPDQAADADSVEPEPALPLVAEGGGAGSAYNPHPLLQAPASTETLAWRELLHRIANTPVGLAGSIEVGQYWTCPDAIALQSDRLVNFAPRPGAAPRAILTETGRELAQAMLDQWALSLEAIAHPDFVRLHHAAEAFDGTNYATPWLAHIPVAALYAEADIGPAPVQSDVEQIAQEGRAPLGLSEIRLSPVMDRGHWALNHNGLRLADLVWSHHHLSDDDAQAFAHRLATAFNAAQDTAHA